MKIYVSKTLQSFIMDNVIPIVANILFDHGYAHLIDAVFENEFDPRAIPPTEHCLIFSENKFRLKHRKAHGFTEKRKATIFVFDPYTKKLATIPKLVRATLHEFGHSIGMAHDLTGPAEWSIMAPEIPANLNHTDNIYDELNRINTSGHDKFTPKMEDLPYLKLDENWHQGSAFIKFGSKYSVVGIKFKDDILCLQRPGERPENESLIEYIKRHKIKHAIKDGMLILYDYKFAPKSGKGVYTYDVGRKASLNICLV